MIYIMINGKLVLAIVPARGGSKGIPLKNIQLMSGVPLVSRVGETIENVIEIDRAIVSTDNDEIAAVAEAAGIDAPFLRPENISGDRVGDREVLVHALFEVERLDQVHYDLIVMLQPTSPLRKAIDVSRAIQMLDNGGWDAVWTVSATDSKSHPLKQLTISSENALEYYDPRGAQIIARQQLDQVFHRNGVAYVITRDCLLESETLKGMRTGALVIETPQVSIDTSWDLALAEYLFELDNS